MGYFKNLQKPVKDEEKDPVPVTKETEKKPRMQEGKSPMQMQEEKDKKVAMADSSSSYAGKQLSSQKKKAKKVDVCFDYDDTIQRGGVDLKGVFGKTDPVDATPVEAIAENETTFFVNITYRTTFFYDAHDNLGPKKQINITSPDDPVITNENYRQIADDLMPQPSGFAPRKKYWSAALALEHEEFHTHDAHEINKEGVRRAQEWLNKKHVKTKEELKKLLQDAYDRINDYYGIHMGKAAEYRAYQAGYKSYRALADAIRKKGKAGEYP